MNTKKLSQWTQDASGGTLTLYFTKGEVSVYLNSFQEAHKLQTAIQEELQRARYNARAQLLNQINSIEP